MPYGATLKGVHPQVQKRYRTLRAAMAQLGYPIWLTSGRRDRARQAQLYAAWVAGKSKLPAAPPGRSMHELGLAFDIGGSAEGLQIAGQLAPFLGLRWGGNFTTPDPVHFEVAA